MLVRAENLEALQQGENDIDLLANKYVKMTVGEGYPCLRARP